LQNKMSKRVFKGCLWILLKNPEHLNPDRQGCERACNCKSCWGPIKRWPKAAACGSSRAKIRPGLRWVWSKFLSISAVLVLPIGSTRNMSRTGHWTGQLYPKFLISSEAWLPRSHVADYGKFSTKIHVII
jgi:hypothetical protein